MSNFKIILFVLISNFCKAQDLTQTQNAAVKDNSGYVSQDTSQYVTFYVYRPKKWKNHLDKYSVNIGDSIIYRVRNNSKHVLKIYKEGRIEVWAESGNKKSIIEIDAKFGNSYYIKCSFDVGFYMLYPKLLLAPESEAKDEWNAIEQKSGDEE